MTAEVRLALVGFGNVGRRFAERLLGDYGPHHYSQILQHGGGQLVLHPEGVGRAHSPKRGLLLLLLSVADQRAPRFLLALTGGGRLRKNDSCSSPASFEKGSPISRQFLQTRFCSRASDRQLEEMACKS